MTYSRRALAVKTARLRSKASHPTSDVGHCLRETRECLAIPAKAPTALDAWHAAEHKHGYDGTDAFLRSIPRGCPIFWKGSKRIWINKQLVDPGHVALATGYGSNCYSVDIMRAGYFDKVPIDLIRRKWGLTFLGWTEDLNGVKVYP